MSDVDFSDDEFLEYLDDYAYVEEGFHVADELAERTVASPPPFGDEDDYLDWDRFEYFEDIEDGTLGYWDYEGRKKKDVEVDAKVGQKRRRATNGGSASKKQKMAGNVARKVFDRPLSPTPTVAWRSQASRNKPDVFPSDATEQKPFALLRDWRERFKDSPPRKLTHISVASEKVNTKSKTPPQVDLPSSGVMDKNVEIDEDSLRAALASRLGGAGPGLEGLDPNILVQYAMRMLGGEEDSDEIAGDLVDDLLDRDDDDPAATGISDFLSRQREAHKPQDKPEDTITTPDDSLVDEQVTSTRKTPLSASTTKQDQPPTPSSSNTSSNVPLSKEAASPLPRATTTKHRESRQQAAEKKSAPGAPKKRKAESPSPDEESSTAPKSKRRTFDAPTNSSRARTSSRIASKGRKR